MVDYRLTSRTQQVGENLYMVTVSAHRVDAPRQGGFSRQAECRSPSEAQWLREILSDQVKTAVEAVGGRITAEDLG